MHTGKKIYFDEQKYISFLPTNREEGGGESLYFNKHKLILMHPSFIVKSTVVIKPDFTTF